MRAVVAAIDLSDFCVQRSYRPAQLTRTAEGQSKVRLIQLNMAFLV